MTGGSGGGVLTAWIVGKTDRFKAAVAQKPVINWTSEVLTADGWFATGDGLRWLKDLSAALSPGQPIYVMLYAGMIVFFCFFYTALVFNSRETADNLKKSGAFIPGIRPGDQTAKYLEKILTRLTLAVHPLPETFGAVNVTVRYYVDGTLISTDYATRFPIVTCSAGPTNSIRGAAFLTGLKDAIVMYEANVRAGTVRA